MEFTRDIYGNGKLYRLSMEPSGIDISGENKILKIDSDKITGDLNIDGNIEINGNSNIDTDLHINNTANPKIRLSHQGQSSTGYLQFCTNGPSTEYGQGQYTDVQITGTDHAISFESQKNNETKVDILTVHADGRVAIGATNTTEKLEVDGIIKVPQNCLRDGNNIGGAIPSGGVIMWSGSSIPNGWLICDGTYGTPDLTNRFVMGGTTSQVGTIGGSDEKTLQINHMPSHTHNTTSTQAANHTHTISEESIKANAAVQWAAFGTGNNSRVKVMSGYFANLGAAVPNAERAHNHTMHSAGEHTHTVTIDPAGEVTPDAFDIKPEYYSLAYIMKL